MSRYGGVANIVRFNRGKYLGALLGLVVLLMAGAVGPWPTHAFLALGAVLVGTVGSLGVSYWVYDASPLYQLEWADEITDADRIIVVHAGLDEVSGTLRERHPGHLESISFFSRLEKVEPSLRRAESSSPLTLSAEPAPDGRLLEASTADWIVAFMCLHELRSPSLRQRILTELRHGLDDDGQIVVVEQLRDIPNALAFTVGVFHFVSKRAWKIDFAAAKLAVIAETKITPFVSIFRLQAEDA